MIGFTLVLFVVFLPYITFGKDCDVKTKDGVCFGHQLKNEKFLLADGFTNLNHGSYGTVAKPVAERQYAYFLEQEAYPDTWFRTNYFTYVDTARSMLAAAVNATTDDLVLVENASSAMNSILRSLGLKGGDKVLYLSTAYGMVTETLSWLVDTEGIELVEVKVDFPMSGSEQMMGAVTSALKANPDVKLCIFSHISSMPAVIEPIEEFIPLVRSLSSALVVVDGAHAPGQIPVDLGSLGADFYLGNCHKWMYAPKGTAFLWTTPAQQLGDESNQRSPEPTVISSSGKHDYVGRYSYTGTRDYTHFTSVPEALKFREYLGGDSVIMGYCSKLANDGAKLLVNKWNTRMLVPLNMSAFLFNVVLPSSDVDALMYVQQTLDVDYHIYFVFGSVESSTGDSTETIWFARLSAQVYLELSDFEKLGDLVLELLKKYQSK